MNTETAPEADTTEGAASGLNAGLGTDNDVLHKLHRFVRSPGYFETEWIEDAIDEITRLRGIEIVAKKTREHWAHDRKVLFDEINRIRNLALCDCGDHFTEHDKGQCGKCISCTTSVYSVKIIGLDGEIERLQEALDDLLEICELNGMHSDLTYQQCKAAYLKSVTPNELK